MFFVEKFHSRSIAGALVAALACAGCGAGVLDVNVKLVLRTCAEDPALDPLAGAQRLRFTVYGPDIDPFKWQTQETLVQKTAELPGIPAGKARNIVVEALAQPGDVVVARGESGPVDLDVPEDELSFSVFLRRIDSFTPAATQAAPTACAELSTPRAGHTATLLGNGRVLIAGGYFDAPDGGRRYLKTTEIYDPRTGLVSAGPEMNQPRAYHTATKIPGTPYTVLAGGEFDPTPNSTGAALGGADVFDEQKNVFFFRRLKEARTRHAAAVPPKGGRLLLVGGQNAAGVPLNSTEEFNVQTTEFDFGPKLPRGRTELGAVGLDTGVGVVVAVGGYDGAGVSKAVSVFSARSGGGYTLVDETAAPVLADGRLWPALVPLEGDRFLVTGGFTSRPPNELLHPASSNFTDLVNVNTKQVIRTDATLVQRRGHGGAIALLDGTVLVAGGGWQSGGKNLSHADADVLYAKEGAAGGFTVRPATGKLRDGRWFARYTLLGDGTVLVSGGIAYGTDGVASFLRSIELFQPSYMTTRTSPYR